jgi:Fe-S-cluster containining protein
MVEHNMTPEAILKDYARLSLEDHFMFSCDPSMQCFTHCCNDVTIVLTPYDVLRMKRALEMDSSDFLEKYTISPFAKDQKIPAVILKMDSQTKNCPFVTDQGCSIYANRPWACRMYPLGLAEPDKRTPTERGFYFVIREDLCLGHAGGREIKVCDWITEQGIEEYDMMGASFKDLMLLPSWNKDELLSPQQIEMYYMACYDMDRFRRFVFDTSFLQMFDVHEDRVAAMRKDDLELLDFAMQWLKFSLFQEHSLKIKPSVVEAKKAAAAQTGQK